MADRALVRLHKYLSECGVASRRKSETLISSGKVKVNGQIVTELGRKIDPVIDRVQVGKRPVTPPHKGILILNKPRGFVSTLSDPEGRPTVAEFLTKHYKSYFPVGRLDWDSTGLLIFTNDGDLAQRLMHPRYSVERVYEVRVEGHVAENACARIAGGVHLNDGLVRARIKFLSADADSTWVEIRVREGRNRLVRRLLEKVGYPVIKLKRVAYGPFKLGRLQTGQIKKLSEKEYQFYRGKLLGEALGRRRKKRTSGER